MQVAFCLRGIKEILVSILSSLLLFFITYKTYVACSYPVLGAARKS